jgi:DNA-binding ferritin-like protein
VTDSKQGRLVHDLEGATVRQEWGAVKENQIRLDSEDAARMVEELNAAHAGAFNLFYLVRKHYWTAEGAEYGDVAGFLEDAYRRLRAISDDFATRIVELGGVPASTPPALQQYAPVHLEAEHLYDLRASLEGDRDAYATLVACVRDAVTVAKRIGDEGSRELLESRLEELEADGDQLDSYLDDDTLVRGR